MQSVSPVFLSEFLPLLPAVVEERPPRLIHPGGILHADPDNISPVALRLGMLLAISYHNIAVEQVSSDRFAPGPIPLPQLIDCLPFLVLALTEVPARPTAVAHCAAPFCKTLLSSVFEAAASRTASELSGCEKGTRTTVAADTPANLSTASPWPFASVWAYF